MASAITTGWIFKARVRELLGVSPARVNQLIESGVLGIRQIPGGFARVSLADVEALLARSTRPRGATADPAASATTSDSASPLIGPRGGRASRPGSSDAAMVAIGESAEARV